MYKVIFCTVLLVSLSGFGFGQKQKRTPAGSGSSVSGQSSSDASAVLNSGTRIDGQLQSTLDVKKARVGDQVVLKTTKAIKQNGQTIVPKGSKLIGRVTDVQQKSKSNGESRLGLVFDQLESSQLSSAISASIISITDLGANNGGGGMGDTDIFGSSSTSARASSNSSAGGSGGGGLLGGVTNTVGGVLNNTVQTVGGVTNTAGQTIGNTTGTLGQTVNGIHISNAVNGSVQSGSTLSAANKNIRLEKGATIQLQLTNAVVAQ